MKGVANSILASLLISVFILSFTNFIMFFPWYLTLVYETFNLSVRAANVNCITSEMIDDVHRDLDSKPLFRRCKSDLKICLNRTEIYADTSPTQRGVTFDVGLKTRFPFVLKVFGKEYVFTAPVSLHIPTTGTRFYKDIP